MSDTDGPAGQELCVLYREAIDWIAFRNFKGRAVGVGPRPLEKLPRFGYDDDDDDVEYGIDIVAAFSLRNCCLITQQREEYVFMPMREALRMRLPYLFPFSLPLNS